MFNLKFIFQLNVVKMASVRALYAWISSRRRNSRRAICSGVVEIDRRSFSPECHFCKRWLQRTALQNEAPPAKFYCSLEEGCSGESCSGSVQISAERGFS
jgi:hypothetical protein